MNCEFEESEYRGILFNQIEKNTHLVWEPGQIFEKIIGIDRASYCLDNYLWNLYGYSAPLPGIIPRLNKFKYIWVKKSPKKLLPDFSLNLFIQAKRPIYSKRSSKNLSKVGVTGSYWHFELTAHQQIALEKLSDSIGSKALVIYACPVFHLRQDLYDHTVNQTVVKNSTFPIAKKLKGHTKWYFNKPGTTGVVNPKYQAIEGPEITSVIEQMRQQEGEFISDNSINNLALLANGISSTVSSQTNRFESTVFASWMNQIDDYLEAYGSKEIPGLREIMTITTYCHIQKLEWLTF